MNGAWLRKYRRHPLTILTVSPVIGCVELNAGTPADQLPIVTDAVETAEQFAANQVLIAGQLGFNVQDAVANAFASYANIKLEYHNTNSVLPDPPGGPDWPDPDLSPSVFQTYASNHRDTTTYRWVIFYVNHTVHNNTTSCGYGGAYTNTAGTNAVWTHPTPRWTFVFLTDIQQHEQTLCSPNATDQQLQNVVTHAVAHEYGHQRAGLTEDYGADSISFHHGPVPRNRVDVMTPLLTTQAVVEARGHADVVFDSYGNELKGDNSTCRGNLITNQSVR